MGVVASGARCDVATGGQMQGGYLEAPPHKGDMRVLAACEESQRVCAEFRRLGHEAYSCDLEPCSGGHPEWHIQADVLPLLDGECSFRTADGAWHRIHGRWDMIIAFPPCTYMTNAGAARMRVNGEIVQERYKKAMEAKAFFMRIMDADCGKIAIENPTPMKLIGLPPCTQAIQPYQFGHPYSKRTCLWLKGLPELQPTETLGCHEPYVNGGSKDAHGKYRRFQGRKERDPKTRAKTFPGIARAMAQQWGITGKGGRYGEIDQEV
ncbi:MAG: DNA cytosine methyltransferase [Blautia sp.]|nr:DNA cytosine methyltransferase [Blautia sp.]